MTMPVGLPLWENIITAGATEKSDVIFSKRQTSIQSEVGPLKSSYWFWGSTMSSPSGVQGGALAEIEHFETLLYYIQ